MRNSNIKKYFIWSIIVSVVLFGVTWSVFDTEALILVVILSVLEVTLSSDDAIV